MKKKHESNISSTCNISSDSVKIILGLFHRTKQATVKKFYDHMLDFVRKKII